MEDGRRGKIFWAANRRRLSIAAAFACLPLLLCVLYCAACGGALSEVYLPASWWNDELFYYKQVEGIVREGLPQGYFGFNESHARAGSFGVWNPLLFLPWVIWGLFDWNLYAPILCNLACVMAGMAVFAWLAAPSCRQAAAVAVMVSVFSPFTRFILSGVGEAFLLTMTLFYAGMLCAYRREKKAGYIRGMLWLGIFLTLIRPYYFLLILLAGFCLAGKGTGGRIKSWRLISWRVISMCGAGLGLLGYGLMKYLFSAPYLFHHIGGGFLDTLRQEGLAAGARAFAAQTGGAVSDLAALLKDAFRYGRQGGCLYGVFGLLGVCFLLLLWLERGQERKEDRRLTAGMVCMFVLMMCAIVYVYNIHNGDRHLLTFSLLGLLFLGMYARGKAGAVMKALLTAVMIFFFFVRPGTAYDRMVPFAEENLRQEMMKLEEQLAERMELSAGLSWDNTVIWLSYDLVEGESTAEQWQLLYALPAGFGINYCTYDYVMENFDGIRSRYMAAIPGGEVEKRLQESNAVLVAGNDNISIWDRDRTE